MLISKIRELMTKWLDMIRDAIGDFMDPPVKSISRKVKATSDVLSKEFDELLDDFEKVSSVFMDKHGGEISYSINFTHKSGATFEAGIFKCPQCGSKNRLRRGIHGARCGQCRTSLQKAVN